MSGSRLFINNPNAMANNMSILLTNTARLAFQSSAPTSFTNPVTFVSGCGFCARIGNITLNTTNCAFPSSGSFTFNVDDAYTFPVQVERASRVSSTCKGSSPVPERSRNGTRIRC